MGCVNLSVNWKICDNCHRKVNISADICPYCNNDSFEEIDNNDSIRTEINELYEYCNLIDNRGDYDEKITPILADFKSENHSVKDIVQTNLADFLTFIAVKGDSFSEDKLSFIKDILNLDYPLAELHLMLIKDFDEDLMNHLPFSFKIFYENDIFHKDFWKVKI